MLKIIKESFFENFKITSFNQQIKLFLDDWIQKIKKTYEGSKSQLLL